MIGFNNFNRVVLVGRLFREPEIRTFRNGGKVAKLSFVVNNRAKNSDTGEWEDKPVFLDVDVFNRGEFGKDADHVEQRLHNKDAVCIEGRLEMDQWEDKEGQKRSKIKVVAETITFLNQHQSDGESGGGGGGGERSAPAPRKSAAVSSGSSRNNSSYDSPPDDGDGDGGDIPF